MAHFVTESEVRDQLLAQGVVEAEVLARFIADFGLQDECEYFDTAILAYAIDGVKAWMLWRREVGSERGFAAAKSGGPSDRDRGTDGYL